MANRKNKLTVSYNLDNDRLVEAFRSSPKKETDPRIIRLLSGEFMANGKAKGNAFERTLCHSISDWFSKGESSDWFWRSSNSGGRATVRNKTGKKLKLHCGDIAAIDPKGQDLLKIVSIEVKRGYNRETIHDLIDNSNGNSKYKEWIEQAERAKEESGSLSWLLIHKRDRREAIVMFPDKLWAEIYYQVDKLPLKAEVNFDGATINVMSLEDFFTFVDPDKFRKIGQCE